jgi:hypothetical protein
MKKHVFAVLALAFLLLLGVGFAAGTELKLPEECFPCPLKIKGVVSGPDSLTTALTPAQKKAKKGEWAPLSAKQIEELNAHECLVPSGAKAIMDNLGSVELKGAWHMAREKTGKTCAIHLWFVRAK